MLYSFSGMTINLLSRPLFGIGHNIRVHQDYSENLHSDYKMALRPPPYASRLLDQNFAMCITPQDLIFPSNNFFNSNYYRPWKWYMQNATKEFASTIENEKNKFQITLDVQQFRPNEISVKVVNNEVVVEGKHEERLDEHGIVSRQFTRRYVLPNECDPEDVISTLSSDGVLMVVSNKKSMENSLNERSVPIKLCESFAKTQDLESSQEQLRTTTETAKETSTDAKQDNMIPEDKNQNRSLILKEEHSCLLKPEFLMKNIRSKEKMLETKIESEELYKMSGDKVGQTVSSSTCLSDEIIKMSIDGLESSMATGSTRYEMTSEKMGKSSAADALSAEFGLSSEEMSKSSTAAALSSEFGSSSEKIGKSSTVAAMSAELGSSSEKMEKTSVAVSSETTSFQSMETSKMEESSSSFITSSSKATSELFSDSISAALKDAADNM